MSQNVENINKVAISEARDDIMSLAQKMITMIEAGEMQEQDCPLTHRFTPGCYLREILMPAGTLIVGKIHATEHFNILLTGQVSVATAEGVEHLQAPYTFISKAGIQKVVYCHTDCVWQTVHVTEETDLLKIEAEVIVESYDQLQVDGLIDQIKEVALCLGD